MRRMIVAVMAFAAVGAHAQVNEVGKSDMIKDGLNIRDCLNILGGLSNLDAGRVNESGRSIPFKLPATVRDAMSHNIFVLTTVQQEAQTTNRRIQAELRGEGNTDLNQAQLFVLDKRMNDFLDRPCKVELDHIRKSDLDLDRNEIPASTMSSLWRIIDK